MKKRIQSLAVAILILAAALPFATITSSAAAPTKPTFEVKTELNRGSDGILLFSEELIETLTGAGYLGPNAYVFPVGTKVSLLTDGVLVPLHAYGETELKEGRFAQYGNEAYEFTLTAEMSADKNGIRLCSPERGHMTIILVGSGTYVDTSEKPSFNVKYELRMSIGILLFSEEPVETIGANPNIMERGAYVFPLGTKIAHTIDGVLSPISAYAETPYREGGALLPYARAVKEITLTEEMGKDKYGVRIASAVGAQQGLLTVVISGTTAQEGTEEFNKVYKWNESIRESKNSDAATLAYYLQPTDMIQSNDKDIVALAGSITLGISGDYEKARVISSWVSYNLTYHYDALNGKAPRGDNSALGALKSKLVVCEGFTTLTIALLQASGIPAKPVYGITLDSDDPKYDRAFYDFSRYLDKDLLFTLFSDDSIISHVWTEAFIDGRWVIMDSTWDNTGGDYFNSYFDISLRSLSMTHRYADYPDYSLQNGVVINNVTKQPEPSPNEIRTDSDELAINSPDLEGSDTWARAEIIAAIEAGLVPDSILNGGWKNPTSRLVAAEVMVLVIETALGQTMDQMASERGWDLGTGQFADTNSSEVTFLRYAGITNGTDGVNYSPNGNYNRAQIVTMIGRAAEAFFGATMQAANTFSDVPDWASQYVGYAAENGITQGRSTTVFDSYGVLENQQTAVFIYRAYNAWK